MNARNTWLGIALAAASLGGCKTESYCFADCDEPLQPAGGMANGGTGGSGIDFNPGGGSAGDGDTGGDGGTGGAAPGCVPEICDGLDNDCDGLIDENFVDDDGKYTTIAACGTCDMDCRALLKNVAVPTCEAPADPGEPGTAGDAGSCTFDECAQDFYDADGNPGNGCEYRCDHNPDGSVTVDGYNDDTCGVDDDCDGEIDEDLDLCSPDHCGQCGRNCVIGNGTAKCVKTGTSATCDQTNTECQILGCADDWYDINGSADDGCEYNCENPSPEICDGLDNDCDGKIDNADPDMETDDAARIGITCYGGDQGECATAAYAGVAKCINSTPTCCDVDSNNVDGTNDKFPTNGIQNGQCNGAQPPFLLEPGQLGEICDGKDNDCDGQVDDEPESVGNPCGKPLPTRTCTMGKLQCLPGQSGTPELTCIGAIGTSPDWCNGLDEDCDGLIDGTLHPNNITCVNDGGCPNGYLCRDHNGGKFCALDAANAGGQCDTPNSNLPNPCQAGKYRCIGAGLRCAGSVTRPITDADTCNYDSNCNGTFEAGTQPDLQTDVANCGSCGNDCYENNPGQGLWACVAGKCEFDGCRPGNIECVGNDGILCERSCNGSSNNQELCNGVDDDCDCEVDEDISTPPSPVQVCNVLPGATEAGCRAYNASTNAGGVKVTCSSGAWSCDFPSDYCDDNAGPIYCAGTADICDGKDNNCNGGTDDDYQLAVRSSGYLGQPCASDDGAGTNHGDCRTTGSYVCDGPTATKCSAVRNDNLAQAETCDGEDNDCDGLVDETYEVPGTNASYVEPDVIQIASNKWMFQYEASRPGATLTDPKNGMPDIACSTQGVAPWFNITPTDAADVCDEMGGRLCTRAEWTGGCKPNSSCKYAYGPWADVCDDVGSYSPIAHPACNIGLYDFNTNSGGINDGMLPTGYDGGVSGAPSLVGCWADWGGLWGNVGSAGDDRSGIFDMLGNLREITWLGASGSCSDPTNNSNDCKFPLMGGAYNTQSEAGATCDFSFYTVDRNFKLFDVGFRCCFDQDPR